MDAADGEIIQDIVVKDTPTTRRAQWTAAGEVKTGPVVSHCALCMHGHHGKSSRSLRVSTLRSLREKFSHFRLYSYKRFSRKERKVDTRKECEDLTRGGH